MDQFIHSFVAYVSSHPQYAYGLLFLAALLEAVPVVGSLLPGSTVVLSLSALIATGELSFLGVVSFAIAGAALGDGCAFWLGHRNPDRIRQVWPLHKRPELTKRSQLLFHRYGVAAVFLGRFMSPIRAFVPIIAGALGMPPRQFYLIDVMAVLFWALAHVLPGILAGSLYRHAGMIAGHLLLPVIAGTAGVAVLVWAAYRWGNRLGS